MRGRTAFYVCLFLLGLAAFAAWAAWTVHAGSKIGLGWTGLGSAWPYLIAGVLTVAGVIAAFVWLAFFSERRGYDDRANPK